MIVNKVLHDAAAAAAAGQEGFVATPESAIADEPALRSSAVAEVFTLPEAQLKLGAPPLLTRKQKQARKGLPEDKNLVALARVWLDKAHALWPDLVKAGLIPRSQECGPCERAWAGF